MTTIKMWLRPAGAAQLGIGFARIVNRWDEFFDEDELADFDRVILDLVESADRAVSLHESVAEIDPSARDEERYHTGRFWRVRPWRLTPAAAWRLGNDFAVTLARRYSESDDTVSDLLAYVEKVIRTPFMIHVAPPADPASAS